MQWKGTDWQPRGLKQLIYRKVRSMATYSGNVNFPKQPRTHLESGTILPTTHTSLRPVSPKTGVEFPKCWVALAISSCWDHHSCDGDTCLQSAGWGWDPSCNVTSASHQHRGVGRRPTPLSVCWAIQFPLPTLSKTAFLVLKGCTHSCESAFPHGDSHTTRDLKPLHFTDDPLCFCSTLLQLPKL